MQRVIKPVKVWVRVFSLQLLRLSTDQLLNKQYCEFLALLRTMFQMFKKKLRTETHRLKLNELALLVTEGVKQHCIVVAPGGVCAYLRCVFVWFAIRSFISNFGSILLYLRLYTHWY